MQLTYIHSITDNTHTYMKVSVHNNPNLGGMVLHHERDITTHNKFRIYEWAEKNGYAVYHWKQVGFMMPYEYSPSISQPHDPRGKINATSS
jgi:hypothetical protein